VLKGFYDWLGISNEYVLRGKNAGIFRETETWTPSERAKMQELANKTYYEDFLPKVASGRSIDLDVADGLGQGRVWTGEQAKERGLIDEFGGLEKAIAVAKKLAKIPTENDVARVEYPQTGSFFEQLLGGGPLGILQSSRIKETNQVVESMPADMRKAFISMRYLERMRNGESMLILPFIIEVK